MSTGPLAGLRVVEIATHRAGAFAAAILADLGADVVTVETPDGAFTGARRVAFDRGKRSVLLDPDRPEAAEIVDRLVARADVVVEEGGPWTTAPPAVHVTITPFGPDAPGADPDAEDLLVQALSGNMDLTGFAGGPPCEAGIPVADLGTGVYAAIGALAAVVAGGPHRVEVAKLDVAVALLSYMAVGYFADGEVPTRVGTGHSTIFPYNAFAAADGEVVVAPFTQRFWRNFATATGRDDLARAEEYASFGRRLRAKDELLALFSPIMAKRTVAAWVAAFAEADVPAGPVLGVAGALDLPHTRARGMVAEVATPDGPVRTVASPFRFTAPDGAVHRPAPGPVPVAGEQSAVVGS